MIPLAEQLEEAQEAIARLKALLAAPSPWVGLRLSPTETALLGILWRANGPLSTAALTDRLDVIVAPTDSFNDNYIRVIICRLRKRGVPVASRNGIGYWLTSETKSLLASC